MYGALPLSTLACPWDAPRCEKAGAGFHITRNLETLVRSLHGRLGWTRSAHGHAWTRPSPCNDLPPFPPHSLHGLRGYGIPHVVFPTAV